MELTCLVFRFNSPIKEKATGLARGWVGWGEVCCSVCAGSHMLATLYHNRRQFTGPEKKKKLAEAIYMAAHLQVNGGMNLTRYRKGKVIPVIN
jgi:hypothetical protein